MSRNPYEPPTASLNVTEYELEPPAEITKMIKGAWIAGLASTALSLGIVLIAVFGTPLMGMNAWSFVDVGLLAGLTYGIFRRSRTCAILLFAFFLLNKVLMFMQSGSLAGTPLALVFLVFFGRGIVGTFQFHRWKSENELRAVNVVDGE
jgi:serine/threonine-protein kinase